MTLKHAFASGKADGGDATIVQPSNWNADHVVDADGITMVAGSTDPAAPAAGNMMLYAKSVAGRAMPKIIGPSGVGTPLQPFLGVNRVMMVYPGTSTSVGSMGQTPTTAATLSHPTPASTSLGQSMSRTRFATSTTAGNASGLRAPVATILRGNASARGGFFANFRFLNGSLHTTGVQKMVGLSSSTSALAGDPSSTMNDFVGMCLDAADANWQFAYRTAAGAATKVNLGVAAAADQVFDLTLFSKPGDTAINVRILQYANSGAATTLLDTSYSGTIPAAATFLAYHCQVRNGALAAAHNIELNRIYIESGF